LTLHPIFAIEGFGINISWLPFLLGGVGAIDGLLVFMYIYG